MEWKDDVDVTQEVNNNNNRYNSDAYDNKDKNQNERKETSDKSYQLKMTMYFEKYNTCTNFFYVDGAYINERKELQTNKTVINSTNYQFESLKY